MSAISVTASSILKGTGCTTARGIAGAAITAGQPLWKDSAANDVLKLADANLSAEAATVVGIALHAAGTGQPIEYATGGNLTFNGVLTTGLIFVCGATAAGDINPSGDLTSGWRTSILGVATSSTNLQINIFNSGATN